MNYCRVDKSAKPTGKYVLLDRSFEALYQNLDDIKALRIQRAVDELDNIYFLKDKRALNELFAEQEVLVDGLQLGRGGQRPRGTCTVQPAACDCEPLPDMVAHHP